MNKRFLALLAIILTTRLLAQQETGISNNRSHIDVLHYNFSISINDDNDSIHGVAIIKLLVKEEFDFLHLDLKSIQKKDGKGMLVTTVAFRNSPLTIGFRQEAEQLIIGGSFTKGHTLEVIINYKGIPSDGLIISKNKYGRRTFFADNWPNRAHNWIPCHDDPADKATVEFTVVAPMHYQVLSNGVMIEESSWKNNTKMTTWKEDVPLPTKVMVIAAADFSVNYTGKVGCVDVSSWVFPDNRNEGFHDYAMAKDILAYHTDYIGPYPYKKLANVQSKTIFGGMENASAIFYFENSVTGKAQEEALISHEIVHQWFGNMATEKSFAHLWLSEGFASYLTHMYIESRYGTDSLNKEMGTDRQTVINFVKESHRPVVDSTDDYMQLLNANSYQKGSWVLHMLRRQLGDTVFRQAIRKYYSTYSGSNVDTKGLQKIFESVSGKNLEQFFRQWLFTPENPSLAVTWKYDGVKKNLELTIKQLQSADFEFPLGFRITSRSGTEINQTVMVNKREMSFTMSSAEMPKMVVLDPSVSLLFEGKIAEAK